jgi:16S rRNA (guanine(966)-N(2))-methyltransferase RsmD
MRVVAGSAKGKRLLLVPGSSTRPIMDRVKESLFDILRPRISEMKVLDLFAGSGSVGIEALSQGAAHCTFIDRQRSAIATIKKNLANTGLSDRALVLHTDALGFLVGLHNTFDLIYVAPPQYKGLWIEALRRIAANAPLQRESSADHADDRSPLLVIAQIDPKEYENLELGALHEVRQKRYGNTLLVFYEWLVIERH